MDYNEDNIIEKQAVILKEKKGANSKLWYWIIALLILGLVGWFGFTAGWFGSKADNLDGVSQKDMITVESNGGVEQELATIDSWKIQTKESFPLQKTLILSGNLPNSCMYLGDVIQTREGNSFSITLPVVHEEFDVCTQALVPFEKAIELDILGLPAGVYTVNINGQEISFELEQDNILEFDIDTSK